MTNKERHLKRRQEIEGREYKRKRAFNERRLLYENRRKELLRPTKSRTEPVVLRNVPTRWPVFDVIRYKTFMVPIPDRFGKNRPSGQVECKSCEDIFDAKDVQPITPPADPNPKYFCRWCIRMIVLADLKHINKKAKIQIGEV